MASSLSANALMMVTVLDQLQDASWMPLLLNALYVWKIVIALDQKFAIAVEYALLAMSPTTVVPIRFAMWILVTQLLMSVSPA
jgi:hypothetical protein